MRIVSFCSTILKPYRMYDAVSHHLTLFLSASSHFLCTPKNVLETYISTASNAKCLLPLFGTGLFSVPERLPKCIYGCGLFVSRQLNKSGIGNTRNLTSLSPIPLHTLAAPQGFAPIILNIELSAILECSIA